MDTKPVSLRCPRCSAPLPADAPQGLCPKCLLAAVAAPTEAGQPAERPAPPRLEVVAAAFPQLEILEFIGQGGMGFVFKARQPKLDRLVALKILPQSLATDPTFAERFHREAKLLARLNHPGIVTVHDFGSVEFKASAGAFDLEEEKRRKGEKGLKTSEVSSSPSPLFSSSVGQPPASSETPARLYYLLMEFVDGVNLRQAMQAGRFTPDQALAIVPKICEALQFAHNEGILHRDIKPENILLDAKGRVKIADFGIAKLMERGCVADQPQQDGADNALRLTEDGTAAPPNLTEAGKALGTPNYMAPEQLENAGDVDHRADIYSLGVVFYEMLTGELPRGRFAPPSQKSAADPRVDEVVLRALEKEKTKRPASAEEVRTQVETIALTPGSSRREEAQTETRESRAASATAGKKTRVSRLAIIGAIGIVAFGLCALLENLGINTHFFGPLSLLALGITTVLGWIAVVQIRRSSGRLRGLGLALFDALLVPLLLFDAAVLFVGAVALGSLWGPPEIWQSPLVTTAALSLVLLMDYLIVRAIWLAVVRTAIDSPEVPARSRRSAWRIGMAGVGCVLFLVGTYIYTERQAARKAPLTNARQLALACHLYASSHTNQLPGTLDELKPFVGVNMDLSQFVLVASGRLDALPGPAHQAILFRSATPDAKGRHVVAFADGHVEWRKLRASEQAGETQVFWADHLRLNQVTGPGGYGMSRYGDENFSYDALFNPKTCTLTITHRERRGADYRVQIEEKGGNRRALDNVVLTTKRAKWDYQDVEQKLMLDRADFNRIAAFVLQKQTNAPPAGQLGFTPVMERPVEVSMAGEYFWFDLEIGQSVPSKFEDELYEPTAFAEWLKQSGVDFRVVEQGGGRDEIRRGLDAGRTGCLLIPINPSHWDSLPADQLPSLTKSFSNRVTKPWLVSKSELPATLYFETRADTQGLLQITSFTESPMGVKIRYKLVKKAKVAQPVLPTKTIVLTRTTNMLINASNDVRTVTVWTDATLAPGEVLRARQRLPDTQLQDIKPHLSIKNSQGRTTTSCGFSWVISGAFGNEEAESAVMQIRRSVAERPIVLTPGQPINLFSVTNRYGGVLAGSVEYERQSPSPLEAGKQVTATIRFRPYHGLLAFYTAIIPPGYQLRATDNSLDLGEGEAFTSMFGATDCHSSWHPPHSFTYEDQQQAGIQINQLAAHGPVQVVFGELRQVFSITNKAGEIYKGYFELVGPPAVSTTP